jgi:peptide/nickel transport system substrate-binding protein
MFRRLMPAAAALGLCMGLGTVPGAFPAHAQKAQDTVRIAIIDTFSVLDEFHHATDESGQFDRAIYQPLISYDEYKKQWVNILTKSFKRVDNKTLEFDLREDVVFHNGDKFNADDVKATLDYLIDPKVNIRFKERYTWVDRVEVLGPHKIRIHSKEPFSTDLGILAYRMRIRDGRIMKELAKTNSVPDYGKTAVGTGHYRVASIGRNEGLVLERVDNYWDKSGYYPAPVKRVRGIFMPDRQTQSAQLITGNIDLMRNITADDAKALSANPNLKVTPTSSSMLLYVTLDAIGRSKNKVMTDERVRKAFIMAIDRKLLQKEIIPGGGIAQLPEAICWRSMIACDPGNKPYDYNVAEAKKLLAEAGYPNGFDLQLDAYEPVKYVAEAIAGEVRKVGIRASVESLPSAAYLRKRGDGEFTAFVGFYPAGTHPDAQVMFTFFYDANRDYWQDPLIKKAAAAGELEFDDAKRAALYKPALDLTNTKAYILPVSELPIVWAHHKDLVVNKNPLSTSVPILGDYGWKK